MFCTRKPYQHWVFIIPYGYMNVNANSKMWFNLLPNTSSCDSGSAAVAAPVLGTASGSGDEAFK